MGRSIHDRNTGDSADAGPQIELQADVLPGGAGTETCYIIKQINAQSFLVHGIGSGDEGIIELVNSITGPGQGIIEVEPFPSGTEHVRILSDHTVKTFDGNTYHWLPQDLGKANATEVGECILTGKG